MKSIISVYEKISNRYVLREYSSAWIGFTWDYRREKFLMADEAGTRLPNLVITRRVW